MKEVFVTCPDCGGSGGNYVSREMAMDAGERGMEGTEISCSSCGAPEKFLGRFLMERLWRWIEQKIAHALQGKSTTSLFKECDGSLISN